MWSQLKLKKASSVLFLAVILLVAFNAKVAFARSSTIIVPDDFSTIQKAVNSAKSGDTIFVRAGTYFETVTIKKNSLTLIGENKYTTIIDGGGGTNRTILVDGADNVVISGFTIQNSYDGIYLYNSAYATVSGNIITTCTFRGIILSLSSFTTICGNTLTSNHDGVELYKSSYVTIYENTITNSRFGIGISRSVGNTFSENTITNSEDGIYIWNSSYTTVSGNTITHNANNGISLIHSSYCNFSGNTITNSEAHGICPSSSSNCDVSENMLQSNYVGIKLYSSSSVTVCENTMTHNVIGLGVSMSSGNIFFHNYFIVNTFQTSSYDSNNIWDDGYPSGGNYWSNYEGTDSDGDGIGDTPYFIDLRNIDNYPLMSPVSTNQSILYTLVVDSLPSGVTFTANDTSYVAPWSETFANNTAVTLTMPESYSYEDKNYTWSKWSDENANPTRTVTINQNTQLTAIYVPESTPIVFSVLSPENKTYTTTEVPLEFNTTQTFYNVSYSLDDQENVTILGNTTLTELSDGPHKFAVYVNYTDSMTLEQITVQFTVNTTTLDTTPPTISVISPANTTYTSGDISLNFTVNEQTQWIGYSLDGQENVTLTGNTTLTELTDRLHSLLVYANDTSGNIACSNTTYFTVASPILGVTILSPENITYNVSEIPLDYLVNDTCTSVVYSLDGQPNVDAENVTALSGLADGTHELTVSATFTASSITESAAAWFTVDTTPPNITEVTQLPVNVNGTLEDGAKINATVTDTGSGVNLVCLNYADDNTTWVIVEMTLLEENIWTATIPGFPHGTNITYVITAEDIVGNTITSEDLLGHPTQYQVLPEFPSWLLLPLFFIASLAVTIYKKRLPKTANTHSY
ncbi:MAG: hypothetical protein CW691_08945 [Candidatus Bathyarchaeum sp.]|nr:MAG: hypothetical protein CW691_08945 [Candidatus Bathyarchaeum sp.]